MGLSYGAKFVRDAKDPLAGSDDSWLTLEALQVIEAATAEYKKIEQIADPDEKKKTTVDWLVGLTEHRATLHAGCYELRGDARWSYSSEEFTTARYAGDLTDAHKERLAAVLMRSDNTVNVLALSLLLQNYESKLVTRKLVSLLDDYEDTYYVTMLMRMIAKREPRRSVDDIIARSEQADAKAFLKSEEGPGLILEFAQHYADLPDLEAAGASQREQGSTSKPK